MASRRAPSTAERGPVRMLEIAEGNSRGLIRRTRRVAQTAAGREGGRQATRQQRWACACS